MPNTEDIKWDYGTVPKTKKSDYQLNYNVINAITEI